MRKNVKKILDRTTHSPKGDRKKGKVSQGFIKTDNRLVVRERRKVVLREILRGEKPEVIARWIAEEYNTTKGAVYEEIKALKGFVQRQLAENIDSVIPIHIRRYDYFYKKFKELGNDRMAMLALKRKEQMMNIKEDANEIEIHNETVVEQATDYFNFKGKLPKKDFQRLKELLQKAKTTNRYERPKLTEFGI